MNVIAHRGCAAQYPENTIPAVRQSAPHVDMIEIDVRRCGSGELVVYHDATLDRLTHSDARVDELSLDRLQELTIGDSAATIPTLEAVLAALPDDTGVNIEVKERGLVDDLLATIDGVNQPIMISSFDTVILERLNEAAPELVLALLVPPGHTTPVETARALNATAIHPRLDLLRQDNLVERAHAAGLTVNAWTARTPEEVTLAKEHGLDGLITDRHDFPGLQ